MSDLFKQVLKFIETWIQSISNPKQFLGPDFDPSREVLMDGLEFFLAMLAASIILSAPVAFAQKDLKVKAAVNAVVGLLASAAVAIVWHFPFWLLGGKASFSGSYLAYVYASSPYMPIFTFAGLITLAGLPPRLRPLAMNPATAQPAIQLALAENDEQTSKHLVLLGGLLSLAVMIWSFIILFSCFRLVHGLGGWRLAVATVLSFALAIPVSLVFQKLAPILISPDNVVSPAYQQDDKKF